MKWNEGISERMNSVADEDAGAGILEHTRHDNITSGVVSL